MYLPVGFNEVMEVEGDDDECVVLDKAIYRLVQAARQFFKKLLEILVGNWVSPSVCQIIDCLLGKRHLEL